MRKLMQHLMAARGAGRRAAWLLPVTLGLVLTMPVQVLARQYSAKEEEKIGRQGCAQLEKQYKVLNDPEQLKRIDAILKVLAPVTERPDVVYHAKILDTKEVNALSLPGGFIYVTKGLLDSVESDDELAGVLAHEMGHNAHRHSLQQLDRQSKMEPAVLAAVLAGVLLGGRSDGINGVDAGQLLMLGQALMINALNGYGQKAELEADHSAVEYMIKSKRYNPVAMLQFMEGLKHREGHEPQEEPYIFRTHPPTPLRVEKIEEQLEAEHVPIVRVPGKSTPVARARPVTVNGKMIAEVVVKDQVVFQPAADADGKKPLQRAQEFATAVSNVFHEFPADRFVQVRAEGANQGVYYRDLCVAIVTPDDARFHNTTPEALADQAAKALKKLIWVDFVNHSL